MVVIPSFVEQLGQASTLDLIDVREGPALPLVVRFSA